MIILDTNVVSEPNKPLPHPNFIAWFQRQNAVELYLCAPVMMELLYGAERKRLQSGSDRLLLGYEKLIASRFQDRILPFDRAAASRTGWARAFRESIGRPISVQDAMIAAICIVHGATLATRNVRDFDGLDLKLVNPFEALA
jgi:toxin FitB